MTTLNDHAAIRAWAEARAGDPAVIAIAEPPGLDLVFDGGTGLAAGIELVRWDTWFDELERQELAVEVDDDAARFALVRRESRQAEPA